MIYGTIYRLLILNNHDSHVTWQFVIAYYDRKILLLYLLPYIIYLLQPLDVAIFGPLQKAYDNLVNRKCELGVDSINKNLFINLYTKVREYLFRPKVIKAGFKATGLVLFDPQEVYKRLS